MIITATNLKNNLGEYLRAAMKEDIIITSNGRKVARLSAYEDEKITCNTANETAKEYEVWPRKATYEEFVALWENSEERYEYIDGEIYLLSSPRVAHQQALGKIFGFMFNWFTGKKCTPMMAPFDISLKRNAENINIVQPDLMVICDLEENLNKNDYYMGVPSLVVEILSESSQSKDSVKKLDLYMSTGVQEYWIVNTNHKQIHVFSFENCEVIENITYKNDEKLVSFLFEGLEISLIDIF